MKKMIIAALAATFLAAAPAQALVLVASDLNGNVLTNADLTGPVALDLGLNSFAKSTFTFEVESADVGASVAFNSVIDNFIGELINQLTLTLDGATFASQGSVTPAFGSVFSASLFGANTGFVAEFNPGEAFGISLGDIGTGGTNFQIDLGRLAAGQRFSLTFATVPEPATLSLLGLGLAGFAASRRRRA